MSESLVTVLLISYNHALSFQKAIDSVLSQKTNFNFEILILDDASTDGSKEIINEYISKFPNVSAIIQSKNLGSTQNILSGLREIKTKYFATLETDDYWCDDNKLQMQVDILEEHNDCSFCAHNTLVNYNKNKETKPFITEETKKYFFPKRVSSQYFIEPHTSSRLYRTSCLNLNEIKNPIVATYDIATNFYFLTKGNLYYIDKIMSVYNYSGNGIYTSIPPFEQRYKSGNVLYILNQEFDFRYNHLLARGFARRINLDYLSYLQLKHCKNKHKLENLYQKHLNNFKLKYLNENNWDIKPIYQIKIPFGFKKKIVFEIKREKARA
jgi:glycosyltransferase involved in cell wall biosynthesis